MSDKDKEIAGLIVGALKAGYKVTLEHNDIGAVKRGAHIHVAYVDELLEEMGDIKPWDYINEKLAEDWRQDAEIKNT